MPLARDLSPKITDDSLLRRCLHVRSTLIQEGLYDADRAGTGAGLGPAVTRWRIAPHPLLLPAADVAFFERLGDDLLAFYRALNRLYLDSLRGAQPAWVHTYLDQGKPDALLAYARMKRLRDALPGVIRPDIIPTEDGWAMTELDSVPGGIGLTAALARAYGQWSMVNGQLAISHTRSAISSQPFELVGGRDGMVDGFAAMLRGVGAAQPETPAGCVAIVVSEEAKDYRAEMLWMAARLRAAGLEAYCLEPQQLRFTEEALQVETAEGMRPVRTVYRFFELFDLPNIPKIELLLYSAKKDRTAVTPPFKPALEEKLAFALFHHPVLTPFWTRELGPETLATLSRLIPRTWVLDPSPIPPSAVIPDLIVGARPVTDWRQLAAATQKERRFVIKPSGFSELAWGSRGVSVGHDLSQAEWASVIDRALASFPTTPSVLQEFRKGRQFELSYYNEAPEELVPMAGRARLSPYYFVAEGRATLGGILATLCPLDKKLIHGMRDAIMVPCAVHPTLNAER